MSYVLPWQRWYAYCQDNVPRLILSSDVILDVMHDGIIKCHAWWYHKVWGAGLCQLNGMPWSSTDLRTSNIDGVPMAAFINHDMVGFSHRYCHIEASKGQIEH